MAVWGAPVAHEDDAERAVRAALELVDSVDGLGPSIQARAGVLTGEAAVTIGAVNQGMVAGDLVNTASRLQSVAAPGTVLVGEATQRASSKAIAFEVAGDQVLRGKAAPIPAWRALRVVAERGGRGRSETLEAPFVGRDGAFDSSRTCSTRPPGTTAPGSSLSSAPPASGRAGSHGSLSKVSRRHRRQRLVARWPVTRLRRGDQLLGAGRDGPRTLPSSRDRRRGDDPSERPARRSRPTCRTLRSDAGSNRPCSHSLASVSGRAPTSCSVRGERSSSASRQQRPSSWSSRTSTSPTPGCSISSTT